jgi:hypothetical protein
VKNILPSHGSGNGSSDGEKLRIEKGLAVKPSLIAIDVRQWAQDAGFHEAGVVALPQPKDARNASRFADWIEAGRGISPSMESAFHGGDSAPTAR